MLDITCDINVIFFFLIKSASHFYVTCRNKAIFEEVFLFVLCIVEVAATQCLIGGEGHVRQADLSMCLIRCKVFAEVLTFLSHQCWQKTVLKQKCHL